MYAASALAANTVARSAAGAAAPLFTQDMFDALGVDGGGSLIGGVAVLLAPIPFIFYKYGEPIRRRSKFAPAPETQEVVQPLEVPPSDSNDSSSQSKNGARGGLGGNRSAVRSDDDGEKDVGQLDGALRSSDPEKDLEKGEL